MLAPHTGKVYDPCCGSGGMFVQSEKFIEAHGGKLGDVAIYGQESNPTTWRLAAMNLAIRGIDFNLGREPADTFTRNQHPDLRADFVMANPPFNISDYWHGSAWRAIRAGPSARRPPAMPTTPGCSTCCTTSSPTAAPASCWPMAAMSSSQNSEGDDPPPPWSRPMWSKCMVALPGQLFFNTQIPACLWFLANGKTDRQGEVLFIDARKLGTAVSRVTD